MRSRRFRLLRRKDFPQIRVKPRKLKVSGFRHWLEQQIAGALGLHRTEPALEPPRHLVACNVAEARSILSLIQGLIPVVGVFFELAREPAAGAAKGLRALRLDEMLRHSRLQAIDQLVACLDAIDAAAQQVRNESDAVLTALDGSGHCIIADATARSILAVWQEIVATRDLARPEVAPSGATPPAASSSFQTPYTMSAPSFTMPLETGNPSG